MSRYIALLRGINVGGYRKIKMDDLQALFIEMAFQDVTTYIQSGNVIFDTIEQDTGKLAHKIENMIDTTFGYDVPVLVRTAAEAKSVLEKYPYEEQDGWTGYITFLADKPTQVNMEKLEEKSSEIEKIRVRDREVYSLVDKQTKKRTQFSNNLVEQQLSMPATTRNLRTIQRFIELL